MADIRLIRRRIRDIQTISRMTHAMEMIATAKMGRAQRAARSSQPYQQSIREVVAHLTSAYRGDTKRLPLLQIRPVVKVAVIHITPDRGLCGGLDANINRATTAFVERQKLPTALILVGRKGIDFMHHLKVDIRAEFDQMSDRPSLADTRPISRIIIDDYTEGRLDLVYLAYAKFTSVALHRPVLEQILPVLPPFRDERETRAIDQPVYEPDAGAILRELLLRFVETSVYQAILESIASEQSSRSMAMHSATDNANDLIEELTLEYHKARQESITSGLLDITRGAMLPENRRIQ
jgi:F-type H+-transporting ATPase subunit gamma